MTVVLIPIILVLFAGAAVMLALTQFHRQHSTARVKLERDSGTLHYLVPEGQDAAVVLAGLRDSPYRAELPAAESANEVIIAAEPGHAPLDREQVRALLSGIRRTSLDIDTRGDLPPVRFTDETFSPG